MEKITGKIKKIIYQSDNDYIVALFRVSNTSSNLKEINNKTITITGTIISLNEDNAYELEGEYILNPKYGYQFSFNNVTTLIPTTKDAVIEYLTSSLVKGCGKKTAILIADCLGDDAINKIKKDPGILKTIPKLTPSRIEKIYTSIMSNSSIDDMIIKLKEMGFTLNEANKIIKKYQNSTESVINNNIYLLSDIIDFNKLDKIFLKYNDSYDVRRQEAMLLWVLNELSITNGDTYSYYDEIDNYLHKYGLVINDEVLNKAILERKVINIDEKYFLASNYEIEEDIANNLYLISQIGLVKNKNIDNYINQIEFETGIKYNSDQINAIKNALNNRISIISGGPGTGKTTIINAIVRTYISIHKLSPLNAYDTVALLAPTGRASKRMAIATGYNASTIHRYLKWNKESDTFGINEYNKLSPKLVIVDEVSMIDSSLFASLLKGLSPNMQLVLVGDNNQLPSVGAGLVLHDLIKSELFNYNPLEEIFRQSANSYIPYLAKEIRNKEINESLFCQKDDYNFLASTKEEIKGLIKEICSISINKGLDEKDIQILVPMYKGLNGIININNILREIFNSYIDQKEIKIGDYLYRENDKVIQLVNNPDLNVFNGDMGYIRKILNNEITIEFEGSLVTYSKKEMQDVMHAYAISIHKSQGSEFKHVIMPIERGYYRLLYNKLLYTGVSRAKKSLVIIGEKDSLLYAINNNYSMERKTDLLNKLWYIFKK